MITNKLGNCPRCLRWAAEGAIASFFAGTACAVFGVPSPLGVAMTSIGGAFTLLAAAHMVAVGSRIYRLLSTHSTSRYQRLSAAAGTAGTYLRVALRPSTPTPLS